MSAEFTVPLSLIVIVTLALVIALALAADRIEKPKGDTSPFGGE